jgi:hypothetical protein
VLRAVCNPCGDRVLARWDVAGALAGGGAARRVRGATGRCRDGPHAARACPPANDPSLFHGLLEHLVQPRGLSPEFVLGDVQRLNELLEANELDAGKASFATALRLADRYGAARRQRAGLRRGRCCSRGPRRRAAHGARARRRHHGRAPPRALHPQLCAPGLRRCA